MPGTKYFRAELSVFRSSMPTVLYGDQLKSVQLMQDSIAKLGLLTPITVSRQGNHLLVVDGRKRLAALQRLQFQGQLNPELLSIPYVIVNTVRQRRLALGQEQLPLLSNDQKYNLVMDLIDEGFGFSHIADMLYVPRDYVLMMTRIGQLSPELQQTFLEDMLTVSQVHAFASIPNLKAQAKLLEMLGPYVEAPSIMEALKSGQTVLKIDNDNVLVLPSRIYENTAAA